MERSAPTSYLLPEVTLLFDGRGPRPSNAIGVGGLWYEPEVWQLPMGPAEKVLYAGLCSHMGHRQINRKDLRATLAGSTDEQIADALEGLARHGLLVPTSGTLPGYELQSVGRGFEV